MDDTIETPDYSKHQRSVQPTDDEALLELSVLSQLIPESSNERRGQSYRRLDKVKEQTSESGR